jgi:glycosyltransferase involved in cell wall biosynthesis
MRSSGHAHRLNWPAPSVAAALHGCSVTSELCLAGAFESLVRREPEEPVARRVTALIKTFERPHVLARLIKSIKRLYPSLPVIVVDDSRTPTTTPGVTTITMPYDSGIAAGRNEGLKHVETPFVLVLDDDFVFFGGTRLAPAMARIEEHPEIDIMGGQLIDLPLLRKRPVPRGEIFKTTADPVRPLGSSVGGLEVVDKVSQFFLGRRERLELVRWDPRLKRVDHADFFTRALGVLTTVFNPELKCLHARTPFDEAYMAKRLELDESFRVLEERYGG